MKKRIFIICLLIVAMGLTLAACGSSVDSSETEETASSNNYINADVENNTISIAKDSLSKDVTFVNYDSNGTTVQLIAVIASDGTYRVSLNTCQSCSPSPMAYFAEEKGNLVCQNCGNQFTTDDVGISSYGCNPMNIDYTDDGTKLIIDTATLDSYAEKFANWQGPIS